MTRAQTKMDDVEAELSGALEILRKRVPHVDGDPVDFALSTVETFLDTAIRVMRQTNPSKIRDCARTVEIKARLDNKPFIGGLL